MADTMAMEHQEETWAVSPRTELPGFQTIAEMRHAADEHRPRRRYPGLHQPAPGRAAADDALGRGYGSLDQSLPVLTTAISPAPGAYRLEKDDTGRVVYSPVKAGGPIAEAKATARGARQQHRRPERRDDPLSRRARIRNEELHRHLDAIRQRGANWERSSSSKSSERRGVKM